MSRKIEIEVFTLDERKPEHVGGEYQVFVNNHPNSLTATWIGSSFSVHASELDPYRMRNYIVQGWCDTPSDSPFARPRFNNPDYDPSYTL